MFDAEQIAGVPVGVSMLATFGTYGAVAVTLLNPGIGVAGPDGPAVPSPPRAIDDRPGVNEHDAADLPARNARLSLPHARTAP
ncbi:MAG: hypothetical protein ACRDWI_14605 [Jiangellaceae bacterium]